MHINQHKKSQVVKAETTVNQPAFILKLNTYGADCPADEKLPFASLTLLPLWLCQHRANYYAQPSAVFTFIKSHANNIRMQTKQAEHLSTQTGCVRLYSACWDVGLMGPLILCFLHCFLSNLFAWEFKFVAFKYIIIVFLTKYNTVVPIIVWETAKVCL